jgi:hypothetical protein
MDADGSNKKKLADGLFPEWISENEITYFSGSKLYRITLKGKKELLAEVGDILGYSINKDGAIVYSTPSKFSIIHNGKEENLFDGGCLIPTFSPNGRKIAFMSERTGNVDIWLVSWERKTKKAKLVNLSVSGGVR